MTRFIFVPEDWNISDDLMRWTKAKGLSDKQIEDELESFRDHQFKTPRVRVDSCWRNWIKNGILWGRIETVRNSEYRRPTELSDKQREEDAMKAVAQMDEYRRRK